MTTAPDVGDRIADTALRLLRSSGPRSVTVQAVQAQSGIAKTTIYRRFRDRREMLRAALSQLIATAPAPPRADAHARLRWLIRQAVGAVGDGIGFGGFASLLTEEDPEFSRLFREVLVAQRAALVAVIEEMKSDGDIGPDTDPDMLIDAIVGAYIAERARTGKPHKDWESRIFAMLWPVIQV
ncbi:TetR/AcrR family transcriptional regulator [Mycobacterium frederiksbergense]|uniref:TetR/AcrR family transcriptional regulator n=1 Tax=Mycolicibacterium frederiksbergense TaxID=117567 RepID=UPI0021F3928D|nr:TetR/AcrR family transcriptional regulator [Mycolicibacterium frederiksbergense]MCV7047840.1 TetR/AcrR family transcriptional regulator [Mycolicibacterium frederiksbergense]